MNLPLLIALTMRIRNRSLTALEFLDPTGRGVLIRPDDFSLFTEESKQRFRDRILTIQRKAHLTSSDELALVLNDFVEDRQPPNSSFVRAASALQIPPHALQNWGEAIAWSGLSGVPPGDLGVIHDELGEFLMIRFPMTWGTHGPGSEYLVADIHWTGEEKEDSDLLSYGERVALRYSRTLGAAIQLVRRGRIKLAWALLSSDCIEQRAIGSAQEEAMIIMNHHMERSTQDQYRILGLRHGVILCDRHDIPLVDFQHNQFGDYIESGLETGFHCRSGSPLRRSFEDYENRILDPSMVETVAAEMLFRAPDREGDYFYDFYIGERIRETDRHEFLMDQFPDRSRNELLAQFHPPRFLLDRLTSYAYAIQHSRARMTEIGPYLEEIRHFGPQFPLEML